MQLGKVLAAATLATVLVTGLAAAPAFAADPTGTWQSTSGESRYRVSYCGDGTQLCAKLTWLRQDARTEENLAYLNHYVVEGAVASSANKWKGEVSYGGDTFNGSLVMEGADALKLSGCKGVFCQTMRFSRITDVAGI